MLNEISKDELREVVVTDHALEVTLRHQLDNGLHFIFGFGGSSAEDVVLGRS